MSAAARLETRSAPVRQDQVRRVVGRRADLLELRVRRSNLACGLMLGKGQRVSAASVVNTAMVAVMETIALQVAVRVRGPGRRWSEAWSLHGVFDGLCGGYACRALDYRGRYSIERPV